MKIAAPTLYTNGGKTMLVPEEVQIDDVAAIIGAAVSDIRKLPTGGQKQVFIWDANGTKVVIKFVQFRFRDTGGTGSSQKFDEIIERAEREIGLMTQLQSEYLPSINDALYLDDLRIGGGEFLVYCEDYIGSTTLRDLIDAGTSDCDTVKQVIGDVTEAISIYWGSDGRIVHRDIKPENIVKSDTTDKFVLIDSGIHFSYQNPSLSVSIVGTKPYFSPEQVDGERIALDARSDMYSLGLVAYEMLTGSHPYFDFTTFGQLSDQDIRHIIINTKPQDIDPALGVELWIEQLVKSLLSKRKFYRPRTPQRLLQLIQRGGA